MLKFMLDTNIAIYVIKRRPMEVMELFNKHASQICMSAISVAELLHGVEKSERPEQNLEVVEDFLSRLEVQDYNINVAAHYGDIRANLEKKGTPIGVNDLHIAAHARSDGMVLVTNNTREFERVEGLRIENWLG